MKSFGGSEFHYLVLKLYHPWPSLNFCDHIGKHDTKIWGNFILTIISKTVFLLLFNFILQYTVLWAPHDHWVLKYHSLGITALRAIFPFHNSHLSHTGHIRLYSINSHVTVQLISQDSCMYYQGKECCPILLYRRLNQ